jgi:hypothetical protein
MPLTVSCLPIKEANYRFPSAENKTKVAVSVFRLQQEDFSN